MRAISGVYAQADLGEKFIADFVTAWAKVMSADRCDVQKVTCVIRVRIKGSIAGGGRILR